jgi:outer membrane protein assembly factor BamB
MKRIVVLLSLAIGAVEVRADDWPQWRGPHRDGICSEKNLLPAWSKTGPPLAWKVDGLGHGFSSVAIAGDHIYTMGQRGKGAELLALDLETGKVVWATVVGGGDPNCTPTVDGDLVYALGRDGDLLCAEAATGKKVWTKNFGRDFGGKMMSGWGYSESPLIDGDRLICTPGGDKAVIVALDKKTGETIWKSPMPREGMRGGGGHEGAGYSSVVISEACGVRQYVQLTGRGIVSVAAADGKPLWWYNRIANGTANIPTPIVKDDYVFCSSGYNAGAALLKVVHDGDEWEAKEVYFLAAQVMQNHHGGMVRIGDYIYCGNGHNKGLPLCIEMKTGKVAWKQDRAPGEGSAAVVYADGNLYFRYENGIMALIEATPRRYHLQGTFRLASVKGASWPHPVISGGKLYLRDQDVLMCYNVHK